MSLLRHQSGRKDQCGRNAHHALTILLLTSPKDAMETSRVWDGRLSQRWSPTAGPKEAKIISLGLDSWWSSGGCPTASPKYATAISLTQDQQGGWRPNVATQGLHASSPSTHPPAPPTDVRPPFAEKTASRRGGTICPRTNPPGRSPLRQQAAATRSAAPRNNPPPTLPVKNSIKRATLLPIGAGRMPASPTRLPSTPLPPRLPGRGVGARPRPHGRRRPPPKSGVRRATVSTSVCSPGLSVRQLCVGVGARSPNCC